MEIEVCIFTYVRSLREANFKMYLDALTLTELVPWFCALDHTNYARWIPVHLRDMAELSKKHLESSTMATSQYKRPKEFFSAIPIDQAHDGGAVGLTDNPSALRRWMIAGPEVARVIEEFGLQGNRRVDTHHHDQTASVQTSFARDVRSLVMVMEELGNPFKEESQDLLVLDTKEIADEDSS